VKPDSLTPREMKIGDLVMYDYELGVVERRTTDKPWVVHHGEVGVVVSTHWPGYGIESQEVAEVLFFAANYVKKSYKKYLVVVSEVAEDE